MCAKKQYCSPEERYRHKLNMLEPGSRMLAAAGILLGVGATLYWAGWLRAAWVAFGLAGLLLSGAFTALYAGVCAVWQGRAGQARSGVRQDS